MFPSAETVQYFKVEKHFQINQKRFLLKKTVTEVKKRVKFDISIF